MYTLVKNINGTADNEAPVGYTSCIRFWMDKKGTSDIPDCAAYGHTEKAEVGAHVKKVNPADGDNYWYIVPVCKAINNKRGQEFWVDSNSLVKLTDD